MKLKHFLLTALLLFAGVSGVYAGRKYVGFSSSAYNNTQLQKALNEAQTGDTVFVASGLYIATDSAFLVPANVTLIGGYEKSDATAATRRYPGQFVPFDSSNLSNTTKFTVLDGNSYKTLPAKKHRVITVNAGGVVDGCLIRNGHVRNGNGGGVLLDGGKLYNSIVRGNVAMSKPDTIESLGGGVFIQNGGELINCLVAYNMANDGYGVAAGQGGGKMINNTITANTYSPVFAKIPGGTFQLYKGNTTFDYRNPGWANGEIPKWPYDITLTDFYLSRILTTEGQFAVFCAAIDIPMNGTTEGRIHVDTLKKWPNPVGDGSTLEDRYKIGTADYATGPQPMLQSSTADTFPGLKYDAGVWHPVVDTATVEYPMGYVSWYGGLAYSVWLGGGLPTRAQWQFAARREPNGVNDNLYSGAYGSTDPSSIAAGSTQNLDTVTWRILDTIAWVYPTMSIDTATGKLGIPGGTVRVHEVARKRPNAMGIYDMTGNVEEWCADWWVTTTGSIYGTATDPINKTISGYRIINSGSFGSAARSSFSLTEYGGFTPIAVGANNRGFRPVVAF